MRLMLVVSSEKSTSSLLNLNMLFMILPFTTLPLFCCSSRAGFNQPCHPLNILKHQWGHAWFFALHKFHIFSLHFYTLPIQFNGEFCFKGFMCLAMETTVQCIYHKQKYCCLICYIILVEQLVLHFLTEC